MRTVAVAVAVVVLVTLCTASASAQTFEGFTVVDSEAELEAALENDAGGKVWVKRKVYQLTCPIVIDATAQLLVYGEGVSTSLRCATPSAAVPLIRLESASTVRFAWLSLAPDANNPTTNIDAIAKTGTGRLELADAAMSGRIHLTGPGVFHWETVRAGGGGRVSASVLADHDQADVVMLQGDVTNSCLPKQINGPDQYHVWIKRGRLRMIGTTLEAALGRADIRIDKKATKPHYIVGVRSEGAGCLNGESFPSTLVYVPPGTDDNRLVVMGFSAAWRGSPLLPAGDRIIDYSGSGTVWALGNVCSNPDECHSLITGNLSAARLVAVGNIVWAQNGALRSTVIPSNVGVLHRAHNRFRDDDGPVYVDRLEQPTNDVGSFPAPPYEQSPAPLVHPTMTPDAAAQLIANGSNLRNVRAKPFRAAGNGQADDTQAIQAALDSGCVAPSNNDMPILFFPAGTYKVSDTLRLNVQGRPCYGLYKAQQAGSILVGESAATSKIRLAAPVPTTLFESHGMRQSYFGDLHFETAPGTAASPDYAAIAIDYDWSGESDTVSSNIATSAVHFHRVEASGGRRAIAMGHAGGSMTDGNSCTYCTLRNAGTAWSSLHSNALNNYLWQSNVFDVDYVLGPLGLHPGTVGGVHVHQDRVRTATWNFTRTSYANLMWELSGPSPQYMYDPGSGPVSNPIHVLHQSSPDVTGPVPRLWFRTHRTGNLLLVGSSVRGGDVWLMDSNEVWRYAVFMGSTFDRYGEIDLDGLADKSKSNPPAGGGCGLGFELAPPLALLARRRARSGSRMA